MSCCRPFSSFCIISFRVLNDFDFFPATKFVDVIGKFVDAMVVGITSDDFLSDWPDKSSNEGFGILTCSQSRLLSSFLLSVKTGLGRFVCFLLFDNPLSLVGCFVFCRCCFLLLYQLVYRDVSSIKVQNEMYHNI